MTQTSFDLYDVVITGAGPVGLFAGICTRMRKLRTLVLAALPKPGGQVTALYPHKPIFDVSGYPAIMARDLVAQL